MQKEILAMFQVPVTDLVPANDTWILDTDLYPEEIFGELYCSKRTSARQDRALPPRLVRLLDDLS